MKGMRPEFQRNGRARRRAFAALSLVAAAACIVSECGCAYRMRGSLPPHIKTVAIPMFENRTHLKTFVLGIERDVTSAVRNAFLTGSELRVAGREDADAILEGRILSVSRDVLREDLYGTPIHARLLIEASISLYDVKEGRYLFRDVKVDNREYRPESGAYNLRFGESEEMARREAAGELGRAIARRVVEMW
jgi:hypothetical protein